MFISDRAPEPALPCNLWPFISEFERFYPCAFKSRDCVRFSAALNASTLVNLDAEAGTLTLSTSLLHAGAELSDDDGYALLIHTFPEAALSGAGVRACFDRGGLELFEQARLRTIAPRAAPALVESHRGRARAFDESLQARNQSRGGFSARALELSAA